MMTIERRKYVRVNFGEDVLLNNSIKVKALTLSEQGVYVHTGRYFLPRSVIDLSLPLGAETLKLKARVQHSQRGIGMGLMFVDPTPEHHAALKTYIESRSCDRSRPSNRVLIVDDSEMNRTMYKSKLVLDGLCVFEAAGEKAALDILEREEINLIILNPHPAKGDGFGLLALISGKPDWKGIAVLILASRATPDDVRKAGEGGAAEFLLRMSTSPAKLSEKAKAYLSRP